MLKGQQIGKATMTFFFGSMILSSPVAFIHDSTSLTVLYLALIVIVFFLTIFRPTKVLHRKHSIVFLTGGALFILFHPIISGNFISSPLGTLILLVIFVSGMIAFAVLDEREYNELG